MKTSKFILNAAGICGAVLATGISTSLAQPDNQPAGSIPPPAPVVSATRPERMITPLLPVGAASQARGHIVFSMAGDALNVTGRIESLEPNKTYQLVIERPGENANPTANDPITPPGSDGPPAPPPPPAAGRSNGTTRPGSPGADTSGTSISGGKESETGGDLTVTKSSGDLGTITSDSTGAANVNKTLRNVELGAAPKGIMGSTLIVRRVAADSATDAPALWPPE